MSELLFETDWLASQPVFYNSATGRASRNIHEVIDYANIRFSPEGFNNYLDFGYSVLEQTPIENVKFLRHSSRLWRDEQGRLSVEYLDDPVATWMDYRLSESDVIDLTREKVRKWERSVEGEIVVPTSSGYDSRLLNWCLQDKARIRSFTYGVSENQAESNEAVLAQRLSETLGFRWERIQLDEFHRYLDDWDELFGVSTHAHGMYHFEFYEKILPRIDGGNPLLSGIIGDGWAGNVSIPALENSDDVRRLGYTHGLRGDSDQSLLRSEQSLLSNYWHAQKDLLKDDRFRVVEAMRFKLMLLCYLRIVPEHFGYRWWSPFLDIDVAMAMLNLPAERRRERLWQTEFFRAEGLDLESMNLEATTENTLDMQGLRAIPVRPLDVTLLREVVRPDYVKMINRELLKGPLTRPERSLNLLLGVRKVSWVLRRLGFSARTRRHSEFYSPYMVLLPIEQALRRRNEK